MKSLFGLSDEPELEPGQEPELESVESTPEIEIEQKEKPKLLTIVRLTCFERTKSNKKELTSSHFHSHFEHIKKSDFEIS